MIDLISGHFVVFFEHLIAALFTGVLPVVLIALVIFVIACFATTDGHSRRIALLFATVGATIGLILGASREPVVQAVIPALITLITGYLGWTLRRESLGQDRWLTAFAPATDTNVEIAPLAGGSRESAQAEKIRYATRLVFSAVLALMLSTIFATMWGASMRAGKEQSDRAHEAWLINFKEQQVPLETEVNRRDLGLPPTIPVERPTEAPAE